MARGKATTWMTVAAAATGLLALSTAAGATATPSPKGEVYAGDDLNGGLLQYGTDASGVPSPLPVPRVPNPSFPMAVVVTPNGKYVYASSCGVSEYTVTTSGTGAGQLTPISSGAVPSTGCAFSAHSIAVAKSSKFVVKIGFDDSNRVDVVESWTVGSTGALSPAGLAQWPAFPGGTLGVAISPSGKFVYALDGKGMLTWLTLSPKGQLAVVSRVFTASDVQDVAVSPNGHSLYLTHYQLDANDIVVQGSVQHYSISSATGLPTYVDDAPTGLGPTMLVVTANGKAVYVLNDVGNTVSQYRTSGAGALTPVGTDQPIHGAGGIAVAPNGKNLYVSGVNLDQFAIDAKTSQLTIVNSVPTGTLTRGLAVRK